MLKVGITGNIGSGKTTVCKIFEQLNIPVYYADDRAKYLMANDATLIYEIKSLFGEAAYSAEGVLNRKLIANAVFTQPLLLKKLNAVVHPAVARDTNIWFNEQKSDYALKEAALLVETGAYKIMDKLIVVT
nr:dephospho-CoA kinase [Saprospiraceae bacterium]